MSQKKILIIDYDAESLKSLTDFAQEEGCEVITANDGITGLEKFKADRPDLVIMEAMLPKLHGFELCKKIAYDSAKKVPVIIVTGIYRESVYKSEAIRFYGASAFFEKPWKKEDLQPVVRSLLKGEKQPGAAAAPSEPAEAPPSPRRGVEKKPEVIDEWGLLIPSEGTPTKAEPPEGAADVEAEIDTILKSALADLGLKDGHEEKPEPRKERERPRPAKEMPVFTPPPVEEKPAPAHREPEEKPVVSKPGTVPFGGFIEEPEKKKSKAGLFIGLGVVAVAAVVVFLFVLKPKPSVNTPNEPVQQTESTPDETQTPSEAVPGAADLSAAAQPAVSEPSPAETQPETKPETSAPESKPAAKPQASSATPSRTQTTSGGRASDALAPIVPSQTPTLQEEPPRPQEPAPKPTETPAEAPIVRKAQEGDLVPLDQVDVQPVTTKSVPAIYPEMARRMGVEGTVSVNALISENGDVIQTQILRGIKGTYGFDRAAETSIRQYKFRPAMKDGARVKVWKPFNVIFRK